MAYMKTSSMAMDKDSNLAKLNPDDYQDTVVTDCGLIDDTDELGYCFFI